MSPIHQLPQDTLFIIFSFAQEPSIESTCKQWRKILKNEDSLWLILQNGKTEFGIENEIAKARDLERTPDRINCLKNDLIGRIKPFMKEQDLSPLENMSPSYSLFMKLLAYEKDFNLLTAFEDLAKNHQQLAQIFPASSFNELKIAQKATQLRSLLKANKEKLETVNEINLSNKGLSQIPEELNLFANVTSVQLAMNSIREISSNFGSNWRELKVLHLNDNKIEVLPENFGNSWKKIEIIYLYSNLIKVLPSRFGEAWVKIKDILLSSNCLRKIPSNFGLNWKKLLHIDASRNPEKLDLSAHRHHWPKIQVCKYQ